MRTKDLKAELMSSSGDGDGHMSLLCAHSYTHAYVDAIGVGVISELPAQRVAIERGKQGKKASGGEEWAVDVKSLVATRLEHARLAPGAGDRAVAVRAPR